nr:MAG TPA: hypothetical protein [Caudoviricetes sp.]
MRTDWNNLTIDNMYQYDEYDEYRYMPKIRKAVLTGLIWLTPIIGSIDKINF